MSDIQTGSEEATNQPAEPKEVVVEASAETPAGPTNSATEEAAVETTPPLSEDEVLGRLQPVTEEQAPTRKAKAIQKSIKAYENAIDDEGRVIGEALVAEYNRNPKGLESFAESMGWEVDSLKEIIDEEISYQSGENSEVEELRTELDSLKKEKQAESFKETIKSLVKDSGITLNDFYEKHGEDFGLFQSAYMQKGNTPLESAKMAFSKVSAQFVTEGVKLANAAKTMPPGNASNPVEKASVLLTADAWRALPSNEKQEYARTFRNADKTPKFL